MIFLHELGHYLTAKWAGMKVTEFFLGFGPRLWSFRRGETEYGAQGHPGRRLRAIIGMNNLEEVDPADEPRTYRQQSFPQRLSVVPWPARPCTSSSPSCCSSSLLVGCRRARRQPSTEDATPEAGRSARSTRRQRRRRGRPEAGDRDRRRRRPAGRRRSTTSATCVATHEAGDDGARSTSSATASELHARRPRWARPPTSSGGIGSARRSLGVECRSSGVGAVEAVPDALARRRRARRRDRSAVIGESLQRPRGVFSLAGLGDYADDVDDAGADARRAASSAPAAPPSDGRGQPAASRSSAPSGSAPTLREAGGVAGSPAASSP